jgi:hypothetical protein
MTILDLQIMRSISSTVLVLASMSPCHRLPFVKFNSVEKVPAKKLFWG